MKKFAEIIDKGECYSTLDLEIDGIPATKTEWNKYKFYPQNGMVGEIIEIDTNKVFVTGHGINILKISNGIYVPMSNHGIKIISQQEYEAKINTVSLDMGMDDRQKVINNQYDSFIEFCKIESKYPDARIYCLASKQGLQTRQANYKEALQFIVNGWRLDVLIDSLSNLEFIQLITYSIKLTLIEENWSLTKKEDVSWFIGNFTETAIAAKPLLAKNYDELFIIIFNYYYDSIKTDFQNIPIEIKNRSKNIYDWIDYYYKVFNQK